MSELEKSEGRLETRMGAWFPGERVVFRGRDLHSGMWDWSWLKLYLFGITGREFNERDLRILNYLMVCTSYPDPRLWCNRVTALAGSARSTATLGIGAGLITFEASAYGVGPLVRALDFFRRALPAWKNGQPISEIVREEIDNTETLLGGYGRPLVNVDERIPPFMKFLQKEEMAKGPHLELAHAIEELLKPKGVGMNMGAVTAAVCADLGFATREFHSFISLLTVAGMPPVYLEAEQNAVGSFLPMRCTSLSYEGPERRKWGA